MKNKDFKVSRSCFICPYRKQAHEDVKLTDTDSIIFSWQCVVWGRVINCLSRDDALEELRRQCSIEVAFKRYRRPLTMAEYFALEGLADLLNTIKLVETRLRSPTPIKGILLTLYDARTRLGREVYSELKKFFKDKEYVFNTVIPRNIRLAEAPSYGKPCIVYDPESKGAIAYLKLAKEILEMDEK